MTTKVTVKNGETSNGDLVISKHGYGPIVLFPGQEHEEWISTSSVLVITETHPTKGPQKPTQ